MSAVATCMLYSQKAKSDVRTDGLLPGNFAMTLHTIIRAAGRARSPAILAKWFQAVAPAWLPAHHPLGTLPHLALALTDKEAWQKLFSTISRRADAEASMALMLEDARVRDGSNWDWVTHGYGQSITQLVKVSASQMCAGRRTHAVACSAVGGSALANHHTTMHQLLKLLVRQRSLIHPWKKTALLGLGGYGTGLWAAVLEGVRPHIGQQPSIHLNCA